MIHGVQRFKASDPPNNLTPLNRQFLNRQNSRAKNSLSGLGASANDKTALIEIEKLEDHNVDDKLNKSVNKRKGYYQLPGIK